MIISLHFDRNMLSPLLVFFFSLAYACSANLGLSNDSVVGRLSRNFRLMNSCAGEYGKPATGVFTSHTVGNDDTFTCIHNSLNNMQLIFD